MFIFSISLRNIQRQIHCIYLKKKPPNHFRRYNQIFWHTRNLYIPRKHCVYINKSALQDQCSTYTQSDPVLFKTYLVKSSIKTKSHRGSINHNETSTMNIIHFKRKIFKLKINTYFAVLLWPYLLNTVILQQLVLCCFFEQREKIRLCAFLYVVCIVREMNG